MSGKVYPPVSLVEALLRYAGWGMLFGFSFGVLTGHAVSDGALAGGLALIAILIAGLLLDRMVRIRVILNPTNKETP